MERPVEHAFSLVAYRHNSPFHQLLMRIKYQSDTALAYRLGWWAGSEAVRAGLDEYADVLVPVPLTDRRLRERGYNQARLLADGMGRAMGVPCCCRTSSSITGTPMARPIPSARRRAWL